MTIFGNRRWVIFPITEISKVDFSKVKETENNLRKSVDNSKTFIKWDGETPSFVSSISSTEGPYTHSEILTILATDAWTDKESYS
mgnify:CR=1 FL=1|tara:strand:- start:170 stop:424 length:255 start_codon:yes stop_codon:yes gene_type:complete